MKSKLPMLLLGILLGALGAFLWPRYVTPQLPAGLRSAAEDVTGTVVRKQREGQQLLLTVNTAEGAALVTFTERLPEIDLLIQEGDEVTLALREFEPFVTDPTIRRVYKGEGVPVASGEAPAPGSTSAPEAPAPASGEAPTGEPPPEPPDGAELEEWPDGEPVEPDRSEVEPADDEADGR